MGILQVVNDTIRAWLEWERQSRGGTEQEVLPAFDQFRQLDDSLYTTLRAFQNSRGGRIGNENALPTPRKRGGASGASGNNDALVAQVHRLVAAGESLVDMSAMVSSASASSRTGVASQIESVMIALSGTA